MDHFFLSLEPHLPLQVWRTQQEGEKNQRKYSPEIWPSRVPLGCHFPKSGSILFLVGKTVTASMPAVPFTALLDSESWEENARKKKKEMLHDGSKETSSLLGSGVMVGV